MNDCGSEPLRALKEEAEGLKRRADAIKPREQQKQDMAEKPQAEAVTRAHLDMPFDVDDASSDKTLPRAPAGTSDGAASSVEEPDTDVVKSEPQSDGAVAGSGTDGSTGTGTVVKSECQSDGALAGTGTDGRANDEQGNHCSRVAI